MRTLRGSQLDVLAASRGTASGRGAAPAHLSRAFGILAMAFGILAMAFGLTATAPGAGSVDGPWTLLSGPAPLAAQEPAPDTATTSSRWTVRDILMEETAGGFEFSPDGEWLAWSRSKMDAEQGRSVTKLWLTRVSDGESWQLTRGEDSGRSPAWSPDGRRLAFVSSRDRGLRVVVGG